ncbi:MAG TPA: MoxR family ATPase, partial [Syntrophales bacterium]|nr:MoxR family ATPase [Syntrophales bacterium]
LLEVLSDFQITIPEIGTIKAKVLPYVIVTSNGTRELHDALKRRCLYHWIDYPTFEKELNIMLKKVPEVQRGLAQQVCALMQKIRTMDLLKSPGIAETLDWAQALVALNKEALDEETIEQTLGCIMKYREDMEKFRQLFRATSETCGGCSPINLD